ncbi:MAG TPA: oligosaccharide flippase family protein, partial [Longimicrobium sp.]|nr:oligosaccharide flippase family protein [Longimicrobium sp.]
MDREAVTPAERGGSVPPEGEPAITEAASASLSGRTISAAKWRFAATVVQGGLQFAVGILLARLLEPDAFGVVAIAWVVLGFAMLVGDLGLGP